MKIKIQNDSELRLPLALLAWVLAVPAISITAMADTVGVPWTGEQGVTESVESLMARDRQKAMQGPQQARIKPLLRPDRTGLPQNPLAPAAPAAVPGAKVHGSGPFTPQTIGTTFNGVTGPAETGAFPPDTMGAVGPSQFIVAVNGRIRSFNKTTGVADGALNSDMDTFFNSVMTPPTGSNFTSDPHIRYDRLSGRWFVIIIDVPGGSGALPNRVLLAVSSGPTITSASSFTFFFFQHDLVTPTGDTNNFADYPTLGIDNNALYIGDNVFTSAGSFTGCSAFVVRKSSILGAGPIVVSAFRGLVPNSSSDGPFTPQGVDNYDAAATEGYFIGVSNAAFSKLMIRRVSDPGGTPSISANLAVTVPATTSPITVPHLGNTGGTNGNLDAVDDRLFAAHIRNGRLWTAHNIQVNASGVASGSGGRNGSRWYELQNLSTTPALVQSGTIFDSAASNPKSFWIPSILVSGQGHVAMGFSTAGVNNRINAGTVGRLSGDATGTMQTPVDYTNSATAYNPPGDTGGAGGRRWGDFSYTSLDPDDDMTMWTIQEFCNGANTYGTQVVKLIAPPPATPASCSPSSIPVGQSSVDVVVTGAQVSGSGFYDPGAGFAKRIVGSVSGGVVVNSVTFTSPTSVTLNLDTTASAGGTKDVTIANPDGQVLTGSAILTLTSAPEIVVEQPVGADIPDAGSRDFGNVAVGSNASLTFTIKNTGNADLTGLTITKDGANASDFTVTLNPVAPVTGGGSTTFTVQFTPAVIGSRTAAIHIASNDADENPFDITLSGTGTGTGFLEQFEAGLSSSGVPIFAPPGATISLATGDWFGLNLSSPIGATGIFGITGASPFPADVSGLATFAAMNFNNGSGTSNISTFLMSPTQTFNNGDTISFLTRCAGNSFPDRLRLLLSKNGTSVSAADFSTTLLSVNEGLTASDYPATWTLFTATISGLSGPTSGRFAFNYNVSNGGPGGTNSDFIGIDVVRYIPSLPEIAVEQPVGADIPDAGSKDFGGVAVGSNTSLTFTIKNAGSGDLTDLTITEDGANPSDFTVTAGPVAPVAGGGSTTFTVQFAPGAIGSRTATLHIASNDANENPFDITLTGTGLAPEIAVEQPVGTNIPDAGSKDFGSVVAGSNASLTFTISNLGNADLTGLTITEDGANPSDFTVTAGPVAPLAGGGSTTFTVQFAPGAIGSRTATLHVASNDADENPFDITLTGTGLAPEIAIQGPAGANLTNGSVTATGFGSVLVNATLTKTFTVKNTGTANLKNLAVTKTGTNNGNFTVAQPLLTTVTPGSSTTFMVTFKPSATGKRTASIHVASNDSDENPFDIPLTGIGIAPEIAIQGPAGANLTDGSTTATGFGSVLVNTTLTKTFTVKNTGTANLMNLAVTKTGTNNGNFTIGQPLLTTVVPGASTTFTVTFKPSATGRRTAAIHVASNDSNENPFDIPLTGIGIAPEIAVKGPAGTNLTDGSSTVGLGSLKVNTAVTKTFTIKNPGKALLKNLNISKTGVNSGNFTVTQPLLSQLNPGAGTTFTVTFKPTATGNRTAAIHIASNDSNENPFDIWLSGTGLVAAPVASAGGANLASLLGLDSSVGDDSSSTLSRLKTTTSVEWVDGHKYLTLTVRKPAGGMNFGYRVEVSPNLLDWYSGSNHTTVMQDDSEWLRVRDNTPLTPDTKRFIRLK